MKRLFLAVFVLFVASNVFAQGDVVFQASRLGWDYSPAEIAALQAAGGEFRMYCQPDTPGVVPDPSILVGQIAPDNLRWVIAMTAGHYFCVVTAATPAVESVPSNEWEGTVLGNPGNLRLVPTP